jgi:hypothetical protein
MPNVREKLSNSNVGVAIGVILILASAVYIWSSLKPPSHPNPFNKFYTDDEGQTYFKDQAFKFPPFDHNGKTAYEAMVFTDGAHTYVGGMRRYTPATKKHLEDVYAASGPTVTLQLMQSPGIFLDGSEVKLLYGNPKTWTSAKGMRILVVPGPNGKDDDEVQP